jgi:RNA polymerase sigma factor (sigma-70 family)
MFDTEGTGARSWLARDPSTLSADARVKAIYRLWREHEAEIEAAIGAVSAHFRFEPDVRDDFSGVVREKFFDPAKSPLLRIRDKASWESYLRVVITNLARDHADKIWGKWRPSAAAKSFGEWGIRLEMLLGRDRLGLEEAVEIVHSESVGALSRRDAYSVYAALPVGLRSRPTPNTPELERQESGDTADGPLWTQELEDEQTVAFERVVELLAEMDPDDALMMRLRFEDGFTLARIGEEVGLSLQRVHERIARTLSELRRVLEDEGFERDELLGS